ncbi:hypothetical protein OAP56_04005 [Rickettsiaceae bacterium]|jgi:hypothetical protein|nr:hypothetical protein [Rickettsiaceae bacterium]
MIRKIWSALPQMQLQYAHLINDAMNRFSQEIIDFDNFEDKDLANEGSHEKTIDVLSNTLNDKEYKRFENTALEFCITNDYIINGKRWNCVEHLLEYHDQLFTKEGSKYLKALNNSYVSIYSVNLSKDGECAELSNMLQENEVATISGKKKISELKNHKLIATRVLKIEAKNKVIYKTSDTLLPLTKEVAEQAIHIISFIMPQMKASRGKALTDNDNLLCKKMMLKEILEQWYLHTKSNEPVYH